MSLATLKKKCKAKSNLSGSSKQTIVSLVKKYCCSDEDFTDTAVIFSINGKRTNNIIGKSMAMSQKSNNNYMDDNVAKYTVPNSSCSNKKKCGNWTWSKSNFKSHSHRLQYLKSKTLVKCKQPTFISHVVEGEYMQVDDGNGNLVGSFSFSSSGVPFEDQFGLSIPMNCSLVKVFSQFLPPSGETFNNKVNIQLLNQSKQLTSTHTFSGLSSSVLTNINFMAGDSFNMWYIASELPLEDFTRARFTLLFEINS